MDTSNVQIAQQLFELVQKELAEKSVLSGTILDLTSKAVPGSVSMAIPRTTLDGTMSDWTSDGSEQAGNAMAVGADVLSLDKFKALATYVTDVDQAKSAIDLSAAFFDAAPDKVIAYVEAQIYAVIAAASASNPDHVLQMSGTGNTLLTEADIRLAAQKLDESHAPGERTLLINYANKNEILSWDLIKNASASGSDAALRRGEIGQLFGFRVVASSVCPAGKAVAYVQSCAAQAIVESTPVRERHESKNRTYNAIKIRGGFKTLDSGKRSVLFNATGS